ncbi:MAG: TolC family protein [Myxococcales bacterium]|nr:TolC family protein [Myxococcales bacterium]
MRDFRSSRGRGWLTPLSLSLAVAALAATERARASDLDLEGDEKKTDEKKADAESTFGTYQALPTQQVVRGRSYSLVECLALADRNHPNLWAARARLAWWHGQLSEAKWLPFSQWYASVDVGVLPTIGGIPTYTTAPASIVNPGIFEGLQPALRGSINGTIPLYTFGKMTAGREAATAAVRVSEWDLEKTRQQIRMDVRRAYFGTLLARDAAYLINDVTERIAKGIQGIEKRIARGDASVEETDRLRLLVYRDEILARAGDAKKGEIYALAALRFMTGVQSNFDVPDEPLKKPTVELGPVVQYLTAARLYRPDINQARAGLVARRALVDLARAYMLPNVGIGLGASYVYAPSATVQNNAWFGDRFNQGLTGLGYYFGLGARWDLDFMVKQARIGMAESQLEETRALHRLALGGVGVEVENAHAIAVEAKGREEAWGRAESRARQWISTVQDAIDLGTKDERALTEPLRVYVNARVSHIYALMDYSVALSDLARTTGWGKAAPGGS